MGASAQARARAHTHSLTHTYLRPERAEAGSAQPWRAAPEDFFFTCVDMRSLITPGVYVFFFFNLNPKP